MRTVIFDLDGTLADTSGDLIAAANACFGLLGLGAPITAADLGTAFAGGRAMLRLGQARLGLPGGEPWVDAQYPVLLAAYAEALCRHSRAYPGAEAAVERLRSQGYAVAICTNNPEALAERLMQALGWRDAFTALIGADTLPTRKPDPAPYLEAVRRAGGDVARSFLLGDTITDRDTARAAGVPVALVGFGPEGEGIARLSPDAMLHRYDDLDALAERLTRSR